MSTGVKLTTSEPFSHANIVVFDNDKIPLVHVKLMMNDKTRGIDTLKKKLLKQDGSFVKDDDKKYINSVNGGHYFQYLITEKGLRYLLSAHFNWSQEAIDLGCTRVFQPLLSRKRGIEDLLAEQQEMVAMKALKWYTTTDEFEARVEKQVKIDAQKYVDELKPVLEERIREEAHKKVAQEVEEMRKDAIKEASLPEKINFDYYKIDREAIIKDITFY